MSELGQRIIAEVRSMAFQHPNHKQEGSCLYLWEVDGQFGPSCLLGHALWNLGLIGEEIMLGLRNGCPVDLLIGEKEWLVDAEEVDWLIAVQTAQDGRQLQRYGEFIRMSWGDAVAYADGEKS